MAKRYVEAWKVNLFMTINNIRHAQTKLRKTIKEAEEEIQSLEETAADLEQSFELRTGLKFSVDDELVEKNGDDILMEVEPAVKPVVETTKITNESPVEEAKVGNYDKNASIKDKILYSIRKNGQLSLKEAKAYFARKDNSITEDQVQTTYYALTKNKILLMNRETGKASINPNPPVKEKKARKSLKKNGKSK